MEKEEQLFKKRIQELAENAYSRDIPLHTDFLTLAEQTVFQNMSATLPPVKFVLSGGFPMSERKVLCFLASYEEELYAPPFVCLKIAPANRRFAEELTHRDYLGVIMNLGIERSMIGDIVLQEGNAWVFVMEKMSRYLAENLTMIRHTSVITEITSDFSDLPEPETEEVSGTVSSVRLDSVVALCARLSGHSGLRSDVRKLPGPSLNSCSLPLPGTHRKSPRGSSRKGSLSPHRDRCQRHWNPR